MSNSKKMKIVAHMFGGVIEAVEHNLSDLDVEIIFTENRKYTVDDEEIWLDEDEQTFVYSWLDAELNREGVEQIFDVAEAEKKRRSALEEDRKKEVEAL
jgi:hypothetical protein